MVRAEVLRDIRVTDVQWKKKDDASLPSRHQRPVATGRAPTVTGVALLRRMSYAVHSSRLFEAKKMRRCAVASANMLLV